MNCTNKKCAAELPDDALFCHACGKRLAVAPKKKLSRPEMHWDNRRKRWRKRKVIGDRQIEVTGKTQEEVREKLKEIESLYDDGMVLGDDTGLIDFCKEWFAVKTAGLSVNSVNVYRNAINVHIAPFLKNIRLADIKPLHVKKLLALTSGKSNSLQRKILSTLRQILDEAVENGLIRKNPCTDSKGNNKIKAGGYEAQPKTPLNKAEQSELTKAVTGTRAELFVKLCLYAGLRREEALGLMWGNVHLDCNAPYIDVRHTVTFENGRPIHSPALKSDSAYRSIPIPPALSEALKAYRKSAVSVMVIHAARSGGAISLGAFNRLWKIVVGHERKVAKRDSDGNIVKGENGKSVKENKHYPGLVDFYVTPHLLRHTYITELCASGMDIKKIQYLARLSQL